MAMQVAELPREITDGVYLLGGCLVAGEAEGRYHNHVSAYLVVGDDRTLLVDTGHPKDWDAVSEALDQVLGARPLDYVFPTHNEMPHAGNLPRLAAKYPEAEVCGPTGDYHFYYPEYEDRLRSRGPGDALDLGGRVFRFVEAVILDLPSTVWGFDEKSRVLFVSDGYSYSHEHEAGQCALTAEELPHLPTAEQTRHINEKALYWTKFRDMTPFFDRLAEVRDELRVAVIAPAHGNVITDTDRIVPALESGYRDG
jgi:flavorubredoxin